MEISMLSSTGSQQPSRNYAAQRMKNGCSYQGEVVDNLADGYGTCCFADGSFYSGQFVKGLLEGEGKHHYANGDYYVGSFRGGVKSGKGCYLSSKGIAYIGKFSNDSYFGPSAIGNSDVDQPPNRTGLFGNVLQTLESDINLLGGKAKQTPLVKLEHFDRSVAALKNRLTVIETVLQQQRQEEIDDANEEIVDNVE